MQQCFSFHQPLHDSYSTQITKHYFDKAIVCYEGKNYKESIYNLLAYLTPHIDKYSEDGHTAFKIPHGSIIINIKVDTTNETLYINAPFVSLEGSKKIPLLRKAVQVNYSPLVLSRITIDGADLYFEYQTTLEDTDPYKIYDILREICLQADTLDDEFIQKYEAHRKHNPEIESFDESKKEEARNNVLLYIKEAQLAIHYFENKRLNGFIWDVLAVTLLKIDNYLRPQGYLRTMLEKAIEDVFSDQDMSARINNGKNFLAQLINYDKAKFLSDIYSIQILIPYKQDYSIEEVLRSLKEGYAQAESEYLMADYYGCLLTGMFNYYKLFYKANIDEKIAKQMNASLDLIKNKPIQEAASILLEEYKKLIQIETSKINIMPQAKSKAGLFHKLFGKKR